MKIKEMIEHIGNKLPIEKKRNIIAGNGYFSKKKEEYKASKIEITRSIGFSNLVDWNLESIINRDREVCNKITKTLKRWHDDYLNILVGCAEEDVPSEEDFASIEEFKKKGWI